MVEAGPVVGMRLPMPRGVEEVSIVEIGGSMMEVDEEGVAVLETGLGMVIG